MKLSELLAPLLDAKVDHELIRQQIAAFEKAQSDALEQRRKADADRQARKRSRDVTLRHSDRLLARAVDDKTSNPQQEPQEQKASRAQSDLAEFRAGLSPDVPEQVLAEFVKVRRKKRGALTGFAAGLFREDASKCGMTVEAAATECVRSSWITVKPEYFQNRQRAGPSQPRAPQMADVFKLIKDGENGRQEREDRSGAGAGVSYLPAVRSG